MSSALSPASAVPAKPFPIAVIVAMVVALAIALMPLPDGLTVSGQRILAILAFAVIVWLTEALDYADGDVLVSSKPGLGIELDEDKIKHYRIA